MPQQKDFGPIDVPYQSGSQVCASQLTKANPSLDWVNSKTEVHQMELPTVRQRVLMGAIRFEEGVQSTEFLRDYLASKQKRLGCLIEALALAAAADRVIGYCPLWALGTTYTWKNREGTAWAETIWVPYICIRGGPPRLFVGHDAGIGFGPGTWFLTIDLPKPLLAPRPQVTRAASPIPIIHEPEQRETAKELELAGHTST